MGEKSVRSPPSTVFRRQYLVLLGAIGTGLLAGGKQVSAAEGDPWPGMPTMAGASYIAGMFNAFIRESDHVRRASHTHFLVRMFPPEHVEHPANPNPLLPVGCTLGLYAAVFDGEQTWEVIESSVDGETRDIPETGARIRAMEDVPYVDVVSMATPEDDDLCAFLTNRNLRGAAEITLEIPETLDGADASVIIQQPTDDPHDPQEGQGAFPDSWFDWSGLEGYEIDEYEESIEDSSLTLSLEPSAVARIRLEE